MTTFTDILDDCAMQPIEAENEEVLRRETFRQANASLALEGLESDEEQLALQEEVIQGRLSTKQAIAQIITKCAEKESPQDAKNFPLN